MFLEAILKNKENISEKLVEDSIKNWLRHATERKQKKKRKQRKIDCLLPMFYVFFFTYIIYFSKMFEK